MSLPGTETAPNKSTWQAPPFSQHYKNDDIYSFNGKEIFD
jgi:hypothetical protein